MTKQFLTVEEYANITKKSLETVRLHCRANKLKCERYGKVWLIYADQKSADKLPINCR